MENIFKLLEYTNILNVRSPLIIIILLDDQSNYHYNYIPLKGPLVVVKIEM